MIDLSAGSLVAITYSDDFGRFLHVAEMQKGTRFLMPYQVLDEKKGTVTKASRCFEFLEDLDLTPTLIGNTRRDFPVKEVDVSPDALEKHSIFLVAQEGWKSDIIAIPY
jgi:hypothetical protein